MPYMLEKIQYNSYEIIKCLSISSFLAQSLVCPSILRYDSQVSINPVKPLFELWFSERVTLSTGFSTAGEKEILGEKEIMGGSSVEVFVGSDFFARAFLAAVFLLAVAAVKVLPRPRPSQPPRPRPRPRPRPPPRPDVEIELLVFLLVLTGLVLVESPM